MMHTQESLNNLTDRRWLEVFLRNDKLQDLDDPTAQRELTARAFPPELVYSYLVLRQGYKARPN